MLWHSNQLHHYPALSILYKNEHYQKDVRFNEHLLNAIELWE